MRQESGLSFILTHSALQLIDLYVIKRYFLKVNYLNKRNAFVVFNTSEVLDPFDAFGTKSHLFRNSPDNHGLFLEIYPEKSGSNWGTLFPPFSGDTTAMLL